MLLDFNAPFKTLKGASTNQLLNDIMADFLATEVRGNVVKMYDWAKAIAGEGKITVDQADYKLLYDLIENSDRLRVTEKGQLLEILTAAEKEEKTSKT